MFYHGGNKWLIQQISGDMTPAFLFLDTGCITAAGGESMDREQMRRETLRARRRRQRKRQIIRNCIKTGLCVVLALVLVVVGWNALKPRKTESTVKNDSKANAKTEVQADNQVTEKDQEQEKTEDGGTVTTVPNDTSAAQRVAMTQNMTAGAEDGWQVNDSGWWYQNSDGTYFANGWQEIDGNTYYFDENGYMKTGWAMIDGKSYYFNEDGTLDSEAVPKMLALTFDDGPGPHTMELLDVLAQYNAKATFFMTGANGSFGVSNYPEAVKRMAELGCELGNHTYDHPKLSTLDAQGIADEFAQVDALVSDITGGAITTLARTPGGETSTTVTQAVGKPCIHWDLDTRDWETKDTQSTIDRVLGANLEDGDVILMHDIWEPTVEACKTLIPELINRGYQLVTISEMAAAHGVELQNGVTYYNFTAKELAKMNGQ